MSGSIRSLIILGAMLLADTGYGGDAFKFPKGKFAKTLRGVLRQESKSSGMTFELSYVPDGYLYRMAEGFEELRDHDLSERSLERKLKGLFRDARELRGREVVVARVRSDRAHFHFLQKGLDGHVSMRGGKVVSGRRGLPSKEGSVKKTVKIIARHPQLKPGIWQVWETNPDLRGELNKVRRKFLKRKLYRFDWLSFLAASKPGGKKDTGELRISFFGIVGQHAQGGPASGTSIQKKQVSCRRFQDILVKKRTFLFDRDKWKALSDMDALREWIAAVEEL